MSQINESAIKTPGVYVNELPSFPPSVAQVATAVPAFIGYTEKAKVSGKDVTNQAVRISSLVQYVQYFGDGPDNLSANVVLNSDNSLGEVTITPSYQLFNSIRLFFNHGGSNCYIISVGAYKSDGTASVDDFISPTGSQLCFEVLKKQDEPTLIVIPDAVKLSNTEFNNVMIAALNQCALLQDRFTIMDIYNGNVDRTYDTSDVITKFRSGIGGTNLNYGAAYYPWLRTSLSYSISYKNTTLTKSGSAIALSSVVTNNDFLTQLDRSVADQTTFTHNVIKPINDNITGNVVPAIAITNLADLKTSIKSIVAYISSFTTLSSSLTDVPIVVQGNTTTPEGSTLSEMLATYTTASVAGESNTTLETYLGVLSQINNKYPIPKTAATATDPAVPADPLTTELATYLATTSYRLPTVTDPGSIYGSTLPTTDAEAIVNIAPVIKTLYDNVVNLIYSFSNDLALRITALELQVVSSSAVYASIKSAIKNEGIIVPPSGAIAGIYASVDATRGVWKAPANVSLNTVIEPLVTIDDNMQEDLNIDVNSGKSVNAIRSFTGKGILVWGARTLEGNSNDWRYISVRRFYIMVEESVKKAAYQFVFEPNDGKTWTRIRAMIENYLTNLWRQGALAGPKPEAAFYVKVGLGQTMTFQDILEGKMIIEIGMAPVRPAEFIILRFSQIQQQA